MAIPRRDLASNLAQRRKEIETALESPSPPRALSGSAKGPQRRRSSVGQRPIPGDLEFSDGFPDSPVGSANAEPMPDPRSYMTLLPTSRSALGGHLPPTAPGSHTRTDSAPSHAAGPTEKRPESAAAPVSSLTSVLRAAPADKASPGKPPPAPEPAAAAAPPASAATPPTQSPGHVGSLSSSLTNFGLFSLGIVAASPGQEEQPRESFYLNLDEDDDSVSSTDSDPSDTDPVDHTQAAQFGTSHSPSSRTAGKPGDCPDEGATPSASAANPHEHKATRKRKHVDDFLLVSCIGKGGFGKVFLVRDKETQREYAMKVYRKDIAIHKNQAGYARSERNILKELSQHPFIVTLHFAFQTEAKLYFVMDFLSGGQLFYHLANEDMFPEPQVRFYVAEIVLALLHLHSFDIVHRDLKPENILLDSEGCFHSDATFFFASTQNHKQGTSV
eukprot:TRINITY_DN3708_c0_g1_i4.p1 TRINITY_DN3708_c0_g1~~TRINITY_DN3708_c0_g1_i4.p1  ORF type:complete len:502 (+),score=98.21 TRINITY_DN3708_c0_g1_i4:176-1507(+)